MNGLQHAMFSGWYPAAYAALKAVALFATAAVAFRFTQRRALGEFTPFDWVTAVAVGAVIGRTATASETSFVTGAAALLALIATHALVTGIRFVPPLRRLVDPPVRVLIRDGHVDERNLRRCGLTLSDLDAILRRHGHVGADDVGLALFEEKGSVSVLSASTLANHRESHDLSSS
jgi:uncharacterized membrane protein YcaP (DUF421 family)